MKSGHAHPHQTLLLASCHPEVKSLYTPAPSAAGRCLQCQPHPAPASCAAVGSCLPGPHQPLPVLNCARVSHACFPSAWKSTPPPVTASRLPPPGALTGSPSTLLCQQNSLVTHLFAPLTMRSADTETASEPRFHPKCVNSVRHSMEPTNEPKNRSVVKKGQWSATKMSYCLAHLGYVRPWRIVHQFLPWASNT